MRSARVHILSAVLSGSVLLAAAAGAADNDIESVRTAGSVSYVSGGVGTESIERLNSIAGNFNLKLVFALKSGEYVSSVQVSVADAAGKTFLDTTSEGPWLLAKLPAGRYRVSATFAGKAVTQNAALDAAKLRTLDFRWGSE